MCGTGAMSISEWARMKSYRLARLWLEGYNQRNDAIYHIGYCISRSALKPYCKSLPKDYPYAIKGDTEVIDEMPEMDEEEQAARLAKMKEEVVSRAKRKQEK